MKYGGQQYITSCEPLRGQSVGSEQNPYWGRRQKTGRTGGLPALKRSRELGAGRVVQWSSNKFLLREVSCGKQALLNATELCNIIGFISRHEIFLTDLPADGDILLSLDISSVVGARYLQGSNCSRL